MRIDGDEVPVVIHNLQVALDHWLQINHHAIRRIHRYCTAAGTQNILTESEALINLGIDGHALLNTCNQAARQRPIEHPLCFGDQRGMHIQPMRLKIWIHAGKRASRSHAIYHTATNMRNPRLKRGRIFYRSFARGLSPLPIRSM
jgi:hypothetical protein